MIRVLVVDDSSFMRAALTHLLESDETIEVIGTAVNGMEAIKKVEELRPDVVLLDVLMPGMDGLEVLKYIMADHPTPVLIISGVIQKDPSIIIKSLEHGAVDYIIKPSGPISYDIDKIRDEIIYKVKIAAKANVKLIQIERTVSVYPLPEPVVAQEKIVVIGASTGGPRAITHVLSCLPRSIQAAVLVVQHMGQEFISSFAERLKWECSIDISIAKKDDVVKQGHVFIAPGGGFHTVVTYEGADKKINFQKKSSQQTVSPSIDFAMESAARVYEESTIGVLLTGAGKDGVKGMKAIKDAGGSTIAEDESTSLIFGMPKAAIEMGCVDEVVPLQMIAPKILEKLRK